MRKHTSSRSSKSRSHSLTRSQKDKLHEVMMLHKYVLPINNAKKRNASKKSKGGKRRNKTSKKWKLFNF